MPAVKKEMPVTKRRQIAAGKKKADLIEVRHS
jgi:hypothetical protein